MSASLNETPLQEIYGDNFANDFVEHNRRYAADLIVSNIAGLNFNEVKHDYRSLFGNQQSLPLKWFNYIQENIQRMNPSLILKKITNSNEIPRLINEQQISYFKILDLHRRKIYVVFLTPCILDAL